MYSSPLDFHRAILRELIAMATWLLQAVAALRPLALGRLQVAAKHYLGLARHSPAREFHQAIPPEQVARARVPPGQARLYRCSPSQVRASFFRSMPVGRRCNPAAHCDDRPTLDAGLELPIAEDRYRQRHNRREPVGCGSKNTRSRRKHVCRARPFQILASDKCRCPLRHFAVRDAQSANPEYKRARARKRRASPGFRERAE